MFWKYEDVLHANNTFYAEENNTHLESNFTTELPF